MAIFTQIKRMYFTGESQVKRANSKGLFYFATYDKLSAETILRTPIWRREDRDELVPLVFL
ncbi:MAG: hypothetical protein HPY85_13115 [Anaerolineae bacterium]|nr:hypothetical protein [Anaerolineae bacterium]